CDRRSAEAARGGLEREDALGLGHGGGGVGEDMARLEDLARLAPSLPPKCGRAGQVCETTEPRNMRGGGLEPPRVFSPLAPQTSASANSAILARTYEADSPTTASHPAR